ncbi:uncharacterized protein [Euwallacea fornicatus]|uniref:uncharacterized protein isoform X1 n=1 Tax=Euwallacea fornicatus TaxID=995702 RepID=UPI00338ED1CA
MDNDNVHNPTTTDLFTVLPLFEEPNMALPDPKEMIKCFVCDLDISSRAEKERHVQEFPHRELVMMRSNLIKIGTNMKIFHLIKNKGYIICTLCNVVLQGPHFVPNHLNGKSHMKKFDAWSKEQSSEKAPLEVDTMWYYCKSCNVSLDGTSDAEKHYKSSNHESQK